MVEVSKYQFCKLLTHVLDKIIPRVELISRSVASEPFLEIVQFSDEGMKFNTKLHRFLFLASPFFRPFQTSLIADEKIKYEKIRPILLMHTSPNPWPP